eukprot:TRINITY_DN87_c0_g1_i3.p3 TRINITY_DN87_c0_g1~~TRINITY_DN87_c0_g1_i3.p3  ORF type:complete len:108 (-),score=6.45 TRINITY_DN87_c0_g1_i3:804-1127(-)
MAQSVFNIMCLWQSACILPEPPPCLSHRSVLLLLVLCLLGVTVLHLAGPNTNGEWQCSYTSPKAALMHFSWTCSLSENECAAHRHTLRVETFATDLHMQRCAVCDEG